MQPAGRIGASGARDSQGLQGLHELQPCSRISFRWRDRRAKPPGRHGLDAGGGGCAEGAAVAVELAQRDFGFVFTPSVTGAPQAERPALHSVGAGCGRCLRGGIGIEQQGIEPGFELGEPLVLDLEPLRTPPALALAHLDVLNGTPVQRRQQAPPRRQGGDPLRPCERPGSF